MLYLAVVSFVFNTYFMVVLRGTLLDKLVRPEVVHGLQAPVPRLYCLGIDRDDRQHPRLQRLAIFGMSLPNILGLILLSGKVRRGLDTNWGKYQRGELEHPAES